MENKRTKKEIKTKGGHTIEIYDYITGGEMREVQDIFLKEAKVSIVGKEAQFTGISGDLASKAQDKTFELMVVSIDGDTKDIVKRIPDLPLQDFDEVVSALNEITNVKKSKSDT